MSSSSNRTCFQLSRLILTKIGDLNYRVSDDHDHPNRLRGLKDRLLEGFAELDVLGQNRFRAVLTGPHFNEALRRDFFFGTSRIRKLSEAVKTLDEDGAAAAWVLTTCYYAAYFAGLELLRTTGTFVSYFEAQEISRVRTNARTLAGVTEAGTYEGQATFDEMAGEIRIVFTKTGAGYHQFVWSKLSPLITQAIKNNKISDEPFDGNLSIIMSREWPSPSDTRNLWNYKDPSLFVENGERLGGEFRKLSRSRASAFNWAANKKLISNPQSQASSVALIAAFIMNVFDGISERVLSSRLLKLAK